MIGEQPQLITAATREVAPGARLARRLAAVPAAAWVGMLVVASAAAQLRFVRGLPVPRIFGDELIYSELARSFAATGEFTVRDVPSAGYGVVYPAVIAPAFALFGDLTDAYAAAKAINAVLISLAAVPAYLLARRVLGRGGAIGAAALTVLVPSMAYSGSLMTENAFYPLFLLCVLATVRALEKPTPVGQLLVFAALALAFLTRAQAVVLVPAYFSAILLIASIEARGSVRRFLWTYRVSWLLAAGGGVLALFVQTVRGRSVVDMLGAYKVLAGNMPLLDVPRWAAYHLADLDLLLGVLPFAAACVMIPVALSRGQQDRRLRIMAACVLAFTFWMTLTVAAFSTSTWGLGRLHERNLFYVVPLFVILALVWVDRGLPRPRFLSLAVAAACAALPPFLPFGRLSGGFDALALIPWSNSVVSASAVPLAMGVVAVTLAIVFLLLRPRYGFVVLALAVGSFYVTSAAARVQADRQAHQLAAVRVDRNWIDVSVGKDARVTSIWVPGPAACVPSSSWRNRRLAFWQNEFFNRSVSGVAFLFHAPPDGLPAQRLSVDATGRLSAVSGESFHPQYLVLGAGVRAVNAEVVARDEQTQSTLYRTGGRVEIVPSGRACAPFAA